MGQDPTTPINGTNSSEDEERQIAIRLLQTSIYLFFLILLYKSLIVISFIVSKFMTGILTRRNGPPDPILFELLPLLCINESNDFEPNLARDCTISLAALSQSTLTPESAGSLF